MKRKHRGGTENSTVTNEGKIAMNTETTTNLIRVAIVDQQPLFSKGIRTILERTGDCTVVGEFSTIEPLFDLLCHDTLTVALLHTAVFASFDMREAIRRIHALVPRFPIIFLTSAVDQALFFQALLVGVVAYEPRTISSERLVEVIAAASRGEYLLHEAVAQTHTPIPLQKPLALQEEEQRAHDEEKDLTARELEILSLIASGNSNKGISRILNISDQTVKNHITSVLKKFAVNDRTAAVVHALRKGWIKLEELPFAS